jgi:hypothetical protein
VPFCALACPIYSRVHVRQDASRSSIPYIQVCMAVCLCVLQLQLSTSAAGGVLMLIRVIWMHLAGHMFVHSGLLCGCGTWLFSCATLLLCGGSRCATSSDGNIPCDLAYVLLGLHSSQAAMQGIGTGSDTIFPSVHSTAPLSCWTLSGKCHSTDHLKDAALPKDNAYA